MGNRRKTSVEHRDRACVEYAFPIVVTGTVQLWKLNLEIRGRDRSEGWKHEITCYRENLIEDRVKLLRGTMDAGKNYEPKLTALDLVRIIDAYVAKHKIEVWNKYDRGFPQFDHAAREWDIRLKEKNPGSSEHPQGSIRVHDMTREVYAIGP